MILLSAAVCQKEQTHTHAQCEMMVETKTEAQV